MGAFGAPDENGSSAVLKNYLEEYGPQLESNLDGGCSLSQDLDAVLGIESQSVAILLCTFNGARFLPRQLESIFAQKHQNFRIWISDDGSTDNSWKVIENYQSRHKEGVISIAHGPENGISRNFFSLLCNPRIQGDFFAFADQDDVWRPEKLSHAISELNKVPKDVPALYCSRTNLIDENGGVIGRSPLFRKPPSFANSLVQNIGGGNTMVMNRAARELLCAIGKRDIVIHDWWAYIVVAGVGGVVVYDSYPTVHYRQHIENQIGSNLGWRSRFIRIRDLLKGRFRRWNDKNTRALRDIRFLLTPENQRILDEFCKAREQRLFGRITGMMRSGVYRQTLLGNLGLVAATVLKKI